MSLWDWLVGSKEERELAEQFAKVEREPEKRHHDLKNALLGIVTINPTLGHGIFAHDLFCTLDLYNRSDATVRVHMLEIKFKGWHVEELFDAYVSKSECGEVYARSMRSIKLATRLRRRAPRELSEWTAVHLSMYAKSTISTYHQEYADIELGHSCWAPLREGFTKGTEDA